MPGEELGGFVRDAASFDGRAADEGALRVAMARFGWTFAVNLRQADRTPQSAARVGVHSGVGGRRSGLGEPQRARQRPYKVARRQRRTIDDRQSLRQSRRRRFEQGGVRGELTQRATDVATDILAAGRRRIVALRAEDGRRTECRLEFRRDGVKFILRRRKVIGQDEELDEHGERGEPRGKTRRRARDAPSRLPFARCRHLLSLWRGLDRARGMN